MPNVKDEQRFPVNDANKSVVVNNGAHGTFNCDATKPFLATDLIVGAQTRFGFAVKFLEDTLGNPPVVADSITNGLLGLDLDRAWSAGAGFAVEIEKLTMTTGIAEIILKKVPVPHDPNI